MKKATLAQQALDAFLRVMAVVIVIALYAAVSNGPSETDALQRSADISNDIAAEHAAQRALVASKD